MSKRATANQREGLSVADSVSGNQFYVEGNSSTGAINVAITSGGGSGGTASSFGATFPATGTAIGAISSTGTMAGLNLDASGNLKISGSISVGGTTDESTFTAGTSTFTPNGGVFNDAVTSLTSGQQGEVRVTATRAMHINLRNNTGTEIGIAATPIQVSLANTATNATAVKVDGSGVTQPVSGTVTANAGTNLNTSALALETGGNLASIKTDVDNLNLAQASTTSGQKGNLILAATTTAAPTYTTAQSNPLSLTTAGLLRIDGSGVTQPVSLTSTTITGTVTVSGTVTTTPPSNASTNIAQINGVTPLMGNGVTGTGSQRVTIASDNTAFSVNATLSAETTKVIGTVNQGTSPWVIGQATAASLNATVVQGTAATLSAGWPVVNGELADVTGTFTNATQTTSVTANSLDGYGNVLISINGTYGTATAVFEGSDDSGTTWYPISEADRTDSNVIEAGYTSLTNTNRAWQINNPGFDSIRVRSTAVASGTVNVRISPSAAPSSAGLSVSIGTALPAGTNVIGHVITDSGSTTAVTGTVTISGAVTNAGTFAVQNTAATPAGTNGIGTVGTTSAAVNVGQQTVSTTAVQLSASSTVPTNGIIVRALAANAANIYVGGSGVTTSTGYELAPGESVSFTCNLNTLFIRSVASTTDKICYNVE